MKTVFDAFWDNEANMWVAASREGIGIATEAATVEDLERRLAVIVPDFLGEEHAGPFEIELNVRSLQIVDAA